MPSLVGRSKAPAVRPNELLNAQVANLRHVDVEPDVTWGRGGIDDWGWTSEAEPRPTVAVQTEARP
jgi:hypothetical protein